MHYHLAQALHPPVDPSVGFSVPFIMGAFVVAGFLLYKGFQSARNYSRNPPTFSENKVLDFAGHALVFVEVMVLELLAIGTIALACTTLFS